MTLILRRAKVPRRGHKPAHDDFDVFDGNRRVGRIYRIDAGRWLWGARFQLTGRKTYGDQAASLQEAEALLKAEYEKWMASQ